MPELKAIGKSLFDSASAVHELWNTVFGLKILQTWEKPRKIEFEIIEKAKKILNRNNSRIGHVSLFLREPLSDRLILELSTKKTLSRGDSNPNHRLFQDFTSNYDQKHKVAFYQLYDQLATDDERDGSIAGDNRGYTGWVAVTGHYLKINSERADILPGDFKRDRPETGQAIAQYGTPKWGRRTSEFIAEDPDNWSKRSLSVPILAIVNSAKTIGVVRYTCLINGPELNDVDRLTLESIASIISAVENLGRVRTLASREEELQREGAILHSTSDVGRFLQFLAEATRSEIVSAYLNLKLGNNESLRLFDAHGLSKCVFDVRNQLRDYSENQKGLTWDIFKGPPKCRSVRFGT